MLPARSGTRRLVVGTAVITVVVAVLVVAVGMPGCAAKRGATTTGGPPMSAPEEMMKAGGGPPAAGAAPGAAAPAMAGEMEGAQSQQGPATAAQVLAVPPSQRKVIKTAQIAVQVRTAQEVEAGTKTLGVLTEQVDGFVANLKVYDVGENRTEANMTLRMPARQFAGVLERARSLGKVLSDEVSGEEVTTQFIDTEARLRTKQFEEKRLLALLERQGKLSEILEVEKELVRVRGEIEQAEGQLRYLNDQVAFSTVQVTLTTEPRVVVPPRPVMWEPVSHIKNAWDMLLRAITSVLTALIYVIIVVGPFLVLAGVILHYALRAARRRAGELPPPRNAGGPPSGGGDAGE